MKPILLALLLLATPAVADTLTCRVVKIADGDTLTIFVEGNEQKRIRLSEIDTPERGQPWSRKAKQALTDKVAGETVSLIQDRLSLAFSRPILIDGPVLEKRSAGTKKNASLR